MGTPGSQSWAKPLHEVCPAPCTVASQDQPHERERLDSSLIKHQQERGASADMSHWRGLLLQWGGEVTFTVVGGPHPDSLLLPTTALRSWNDNTCNHEFPFVCKIASLTIH